MNRALFILFSFTVLLAETRTIAISYFDNTSGSEQYNPLSKGLADMLITDLSNVKSIQIVEREKLESLLKEIDLGSGKFIDKNTAQRLGKGLGAGYILTGSFLIMDEMMRIDARLVDVGTGEITMAEEITGKKDSFFELEKDLKIKIIESLRVNLSKTESRRIQKSQTKSFDAFSSYSFGLDALDKGEIEQSLKYMEEATENDDDFDLAWNKLDDLEKKIDSFLRSKGLNVSTTILDLINLVQEGQLEKCVPLIQTVNSYSGATSFRYDSHRYKNFGKDRDFWKVFLFNEPPADFIEAADHFNDILDKYYNTLIFFHENDFNQICKKEHTIANISFDELVMIHVGLFDKGLLDFLEFVNVRYGKNEPSLINKFHKKQLILLGHFIDNYPYNSSSEIIAKRLKFIVKSQKNPVIYDFYKEYFSVVDPMADLITPSHDFKELKIYSSDFRNIVVPDGVEYLSEYIEEIYIHYNPIIKETDNQFKIEELNGNNHFSVYSRRKSYDRLYNKEIYEEYFDSDTLYIPDALLKLKNLKSIEIKNIKSRYVHFPDQLNDLTSLEKIKTNSSEDNIKDLSRRFPKINITR